MPRYEYPSRPPLPRPFCCAYRGQVAVDSARQLSMAHAHAGAIELMTGKPAEAAVLFGHQLDEARKASMEIHEEAGLCATRNQAVGDSR